MNRMNTVIKTVFRIHFSRTSVTSTNVVGVRIRGKIKNQSFTEDQVRRSLGPILRASRVRASRCPLQTQDAPETNSEQWPAHCYLPSLAQRLYVSMFARYVFRDASLLTPFS